jgi:hypothetical protein
VTPCEDCHMKLDGVVGTDYAVSINKPDTLSRKHIRI